MTHPRACFDYCDNSIKVETDACNLAKQQGKEPPIWLVDELDKADPKFFTIWNNIIERGFLRRPGYKDKNGIDIPEVKADLTGVDVIFTSNFAQREIRDFMKGKEKLVDHDLDEMKSMIQKSADHEK